VVMFTTESS